MRHSIRGCKAAGSHRHISGARTALVAAFAIVAAGGLLLGGRGNAVLAQSVSSPGAVVRIVQADRPGTPSAGTEIAIHAVRSADPVPQVAGASLTFSGGKDASRLHVATPGSGQISERLAGMVRKTEPPVSQVSLSLDIPPGASSTPAPTTSPARSEVKLSACSEPEPAVIAPAGEQFSANEQSSGNVLRATSNMPQQLEFTPVATDQSPARPLPLPEPHQEPASFAPANVLRGEGGDRTGQSVQAASYSDERAAGFAGSQGLRPSADSPTVFSAPATPLAKSSAGPALARPSSADLAPAGSSLAQQMPPAEPNRLGPFQVTDRLGELEVMSRCGKVLRTSLEVVRIAVADREICDAAQFAPGELSVIGKRPGETHVTFWFREGQHPPITCLIRVTPHPLVVEPVFEAR